MKNYREQDACVNCAHSFMECGYQHTSLFCTKNAPERPEGSEGELWDGQLSAEENLKLKCEWDAWREGRGVYEHGICDDFEKEDGDDS